MTRRAHELDGVAMFMIVTLGLTAALAIAARGAVAGVEPTAPGMLHATMLYVGIVGWPPLVAFFVARWMDGSERAFDAGVRPADPRRNLFAIGIGMFIVTFAVATEGTLHPELGRLRPQVEEDSWVKIAQLVLALLALVMILWIQAIVEELTWRGYVLPRVMRALGPWPGLLVHGTLWGLSYTPLLAVADESIPRSLGFVVSYGLLGIVLGWLRLFSRSVYASAAANVTLTICAGLPLVVVGESSRFSAAFDPPGWAPMLVVVLAIVVRRRWRTAIDVPWQPAADRRQ